MVNPKKKALKKAYIRRHFMRPRIPCENCDRGFKTEEKLLRHLPCSGPEPRCYVCRKFFHSHLKVERHACEGVPKFVVTPEMNPEDVKLFPNSQNEQYGCWYCGVTFSSEQDFLLFHVPCGRYVTNLERVRRYGSNDKSASTSSLGATPFESNFECEEYLSSSTDESESYSGEQRRSSSEMASPSATEVVIQSEPGTETGIVPPVVIKTEPGTGANPQSEDDNNTNEDTNQNESGGASQEEESMDDESISHASEQLAMENERLQHVLLGLTERQAVLEEFLEVEYGEKFDKFLNNRNRLVNVMGLSDGDGKSTVLQDGKRSAKSREIVSLLKVVKDQAAATAASSSTNSGDAGASNTSNSSYHNQPYHGGGGFRGGGKGKGKKRQMNQNHQGNPAKKMPKVCVSCYLPDHFIEQCPYRGNSMSMSADVRRQIDIRRQRYFQSMKNQRN